MKKKFTITFEQDFRSRYTAEELGVYYTLALKQMMAEAARAKLIKTLKGL